MATKTEERVTEQTAPVAEAAQKSEYKPARMALDDNHGKVGHSYVKICRVSGKQIDKDHYVTDANGNQIGEYKIPYVDSNGNYTAKLNSYFTDPETGRIGIHKIIGISDSDIEHVYEAPKTEGAKGRFMPDTFNVTLSKNKYAVRTYLRDEADTSFQPQPYVDANGEQAPYRTMSPDEILEMVNGDYKSRVEAKSKTAEDEKGASSTWEPARTFSYDKPRETDHSAGYINGVSAANIVRTGRPVKDENGNVIQYNAAKFGEEPDMKDLRLPLTFSDKHGYREGDYQVQLKIPDNEGWDHGYHMVMAIDAKGVSSAWKDLKDLTDPAKSDAAGKFDVKLSNNSYMVRKYEKDPETGKMALVREKDANGKDITAKVMSTSEIVDLYNESYAAYRSRQKTAEADKTVPTAEAPAPDVPAANVAEAEEPTKPVAKKRRPSKRKEARNDNPFAAVATAEAEKTMEQPEDPPF